MWLHILFFHYVAYAAWIFICILFSMYMHGHDVSGDVTKLALAHLIAEWWRHVVGMRAIYNYNYWLWLVCANNIDIH